MLTALFSTEEMASSSFPKIRQKSKRVAPPPPNQNPNSNRLEKTRINQPANPSHSVTGARGRNDHPWAGAPVQQRLFHDFDAKSNSESKKNLPLPPKMEIPFQPPNRPALSSIFSTRDKPAAAGTKSEPTTPPDKKSAVGSPTSASSSSSNERSAERRSRRHMLRRIPIAQQRPKRAKERSGGGRSDYRRNHSDGSSVESMDEMPHHPYPNAIPYSPMAVYPPPVALYPSPPVLIYPASYLPPPSELPMWTEDGPSSLKDIKEDEGEDDIKGFDDFAMY